MPLAVRGHPPGAAIVEAEQDHRQGRLCMQGNRYRPRRPGARTREADLDRDLPSIQSDAGRKDGQDRALPLRIQEESAAMAPHQIAGDGHVTTGRATCLTWRQLEGPRLGVNYH